MRAQFQPRPLNDPATGETYHIEGAAGLWFPGAAMSISSQSLGIQGSTIDFKTDLGLQDQHFPEVHLELRPATRHKFRFQYIPINYDQTATPPRDIIFNGQRFRAGLPVHSTLDWKAYRAGYEYDFLTTNRWFAGVIVDLKYTDVTATLVTGTERARIHSRTGADSSARRRLPDLPGREHLGHRRDHRIHVAGGPDQELFRALPRCERLRNAELHRQPRRPGWSPVVRCRVPCQDRHRLVHADRVVLRSGGAGT